MARVPAPLLARDGFGRVASFSILGQRPANNEHCGVDGLESCLEKVRIIV